MDMFKIMKIELHVKALVLIMYCSTRSEQL